MRNLSLAAFAAVCLFVGAGLARAAHLGEPFHAGAALAAHRIGPTARHLLANTDGTAYYVVRLKDAPVPLYTGGVAGYAATSAHARGLRMLDAQAPEARAYAAYLDGRQTDLLTRASTLLGRSLIPRFRYRYALNGMSLRLSRAEAMQIAELDGVASVEPVRYYRPLTGSVLIPAAASDTNASRAWINAPAVWQLSSNGNPDTEGEGIVVGDIDTGINDANSSFAPSGLDSGYVIQNPLGSGNYLGVCGSSPATPQPSFFRCNNKLIGAYSYTFSTGNDPNSPEDSEGHGTHTASTAAGDFTTTTVNGASTPLSGVAPHASIIAYDVCDPTDSCSSDGSVSAIDQAIQDQATIKSAAATNHVPFYGMVLNYSIGGGDASSDPYADPVEQAFLSAVEAGIYVSAAGGNGGPENIVDNDPTNFPVYPVEHVVPWIASTAAATHSQFLGSNLENFSGGDGATLPASTINGVGGTNGYGPANIVFAKNYSDPVTGGTAPTSGQQYPPSSGNSQSDAAECLFPFPSGTFIGNPIVVCNRGTTPLVDKAYNVMQGGAHGVVIAATSSSEQDMVAESYVIPGTLISQTDGNSLRAWLSASIGSATAAQAQISGAVLDTYPAQADQVAGFSSRGPTGTVYDNLVKPDLTAPGVSVLAALSNPLYTAATPGGSNVPETFGFLDGTSMATPHDTGAAALLMSLHPSWTPAELRSALMLTAVTGPNTQSPNGLTDQCASLDSSNNCVAGSTLPSPQVRGAGRIDLYAASRTGLLLDENGDDYAAADPDTGGNLTGLNLPSLANDNCITTCTWNRMVTSAFTTATANYSVAVSGLTSGLQVTVSPSSFRLAPGARQVLFISANSSSVPAATWAFGEIDITSGGTGDGGTAIPAMHMPVAVESTAPTAHMSIDQTSLSFAVQQGASGTQQFTISNNGQVSLNWSGSAVASSATQSLAGNAPAPSAGRTLSTSTIWTRASAGARGFPSSFYTSSGHGVYSADVFTLPVKADISQIVADGFAQDGSGPLSITGTVNWYIYADASGEPAGNPEDGKNDYAWHYGADAASSGVGVANGVISLDLGAAGQSDAALAAGTYWLIVVPTFNSAGGSNSDPAWYWFEAVKPYDSTSALVIDPGNLYGTGAGWQSTQGTLAFTLAGTFDCSGSAMTGLSLSPTSGRVPAGGQTTVTATFAGGTQPAGAYAGAVCISGNASDNALIPISVSASVTQSSSGGSGGGGGGGIGLLALAGLGLALRRRLLR